MSGLVVTYAPRFEFEDGVFGPRFEAMGFFEVSASRDAVMVHRAVARQSEHIQLLVAAINEAEEMRVYLANNNCLPPHMQAQQDAWNAEARQIIAARRAEAKK